MSVKCACCDTHEIELRHNEEYYCAMCYHELYHLLDFEQGYDMAREAILSGDIEPQRAVMSFEHDPPDCARQYGYLKACIEEVLK